MARGPAHGRCRGAPAEWCVAEMPRQPSLATPCALSLLAGAHLARDLAFEPHQVQLRDAVARPQVGGKADLGGVRPSRSKARHLTAPVLKSQPLITLSVARNAEVSATSASPRLGGNGVQGVLSCGGRDSTGCCLSRYTSCNPLHRWIRKENGMNGKQAIASSLKSTGGMLAMYSGGPVRRGLAGAACPGR